MLWWFSTLGNFSSMHTQLILPIYSVKLKLQYTNKLGKRRRQNSKEKREEY